MHADPDRHDSLSKRRSPTHGVFVENRLLQLVKTGQVEATVVAPVPWFPFGSRLFGRYGRMARVPTAETRHGLQITHPRFALLPKLGMSLAPFLLLLVPPTTRAQGVGQWQTVRLDRCSLCVPRRSSRPWLGQALGKPVVITARGTDLHLIPNYRIPRLLIRNAFKRCAAVVAVSQALANSARALAGPNLRLEVCAMAST